MRTRVAVACALQAGLVAVAVWSPLSARLTGEEYRVAVAPVDPVDPFRGAYVALDYPGLTGGRTDDGGLPTGTVYVPLVERGELWAGGRATAVRPSDGPYVRCDSDGFRLDCGIGSLFASQGEAKRLEGELADGAVARLRVDGRGNAAVVSVDAPAAAPR